MFVSVVLPVVVSLVAISLLFKTLMDPQIGLFNQILRLIHVPESKFLASSDSALSSVVAVDVSGDRRGGQDGHHQRHRGDRPERDSREPIHACYPQSFDQSKVSLLD